MGEITPGCQAKKDITWLCTLVKSFGSSAGPTEPLL